MIDRRHVAACVAVVLLSGASQVAPSPWFGVWKLRLNDPGEKAETLIYSDAGNGAMRMESVENKSVILTRFDGRPAADAGNRTGKARTLAVKAVSPTRYTWTFSVEGKPIVQGINTLAPDQKTFREVSWLVAKPKETVTLIYERQ